MKYIILIFIYLLIWNNLFAQENYTNWPLCQSFSFTDNTFVDLTGNLSTDEIPILKPLLTRSFNTIEDFNNVLIGLDISDDKKHLLLRYSEKLEEPLEINICYGDNESSEVSIFHDGIDIKGWGKPVVAAFSTTTNNLTFIGRKQAGKPEQNASRRKPVRRSIFCS